MAGDIGKGTQLILNCRGYCPLFPAAAATWQGYAWDVIEAVLVGSYDRYGAKSDLFGAIFMCKR